MVTHKSSNVPEIHLRSAIDYVDDDLQDNAKFSKRSISIAGTDDDQVDLLDGVQLTSIQGSSERYNSQRPQSAINSSGRDGVFRGRLGVALQTIQQNRHEGKKLQRYKLHSINRKRRELSPRNAQNKHIEQLNNFGKAAGNRMAKGRRNGGFGQLSENEPDPTKMTGLELVPSLKQDMLGNYLARKSDQINVKLYIDEIKSKRLIKSLRGSTSPPAMNETIGRRLLAFGGPQTMQPKHQVVPQNKYQAVQENMLGIKLPGHTSRVNLESAGDNLGSKISRISTNKSSVRRSEVYSPTGKASKQAQRVDDAVQDLTEHVKTFRPMTAPAILGAQGQSCGTEFDRQPHGDQAVQSACSLSSLSSMSSLGSLAYRDD